jgi:hypothetical protein
MKATALTAFQVRVRFSIGAIARTPSRSSPTGVAGAPSSSSSAVGSLRVPSLSLSRRIRIPCSRPASSRGSR